MDYSEKRKIKQAEQVEKQQNRLIKSQYSPENNKKPKYDPNNSPDSAMNQTIQWCFEWFDGKDWKTEKSKHISFLEVAGSSFKDYSSRIWKEILGDTKRDHSVPKNKLIHDARKRLVELKKDDIDELLRLRFSGTQRLWGIKDNRIFKILWWDPDHQICPGNKK